MDFFFQVLDLLHQDINEGRSKNHTGDLEDNAESHELSADEHWTRSHHRDISLVVDTFEGQLRSCLSCPTHPDQQSCNYENFRAIALSLSDTVGISSPTATSVSTTAQRAKVSNSATIPLSACLRRFIRSESPEGVRWSCKLCQAEVPAAKKMDICRLPPVLCLQLKRFECDANGITRKIESFVDFPFEFFMDEYVANEYVATGKVETSRPHYGDLPSMATWVKGQLLYELIAVSNQQGHLSSGHYTAYVKRGTHWFLCDDSSIVAVRPSDVRTTRAYLLFYRRIPSDRISAYMKGIVDELLLPQPHHQTPEQDSLRIFAWEGRKAMLAAAKAEADIAAAEAAATKIRQLFFDVTGYTYEQICHSTTSDYAARNIADQFGHVHEGCSMLGDDKVARYAVGDLQRSLQRTVVEPFPDGAALMRKAQKCATYF